MRPRDCVPRNWPGFEATFVRDAARYRITVENPAGVSRGVRSIEVDGRAVAGPDVPLLADGVEHTVRVVLG